jgi:hypothetical protein
MEHVNKVYRVNFVYMLLRITSNQKRLLLSAIGSIPQRSGKEPHLRLAGGDGQVEDIAAKLHGVTVYKASVRAVA